MNFLGVSIVEWVGYLAAAIVLFSFFMKDMKKLRLINMSGCTIWVLYGFLLQISWPIIITNAAIFCVNGYYLYKTRKPSNK
ncbi:YgjV family protein [Ascidiimonas sp. W6]|uniref:YgjV family protein n=1 Tax=Ascidiimonas meishanensis TaxID=3128903 RepID=UPI0030EC64A6